jgi:peptidoglycan/xylan/chitin deacetylase (PgdA/CDA1 family)
MDSATRLPSVAMSGEGCDGPGAAGRGDPPPRLDLPPVFIVSLDFELYWGVRDLMTVEAYRSHLEGVRVVVPRLLQLFRDYEIRATWATVGFLMLRDVADLRAHYPERLPGYRRTKLCPYRYVDREGASLERALHFAPDLVGRILATPGQELATHTFSHFYCLERPASVEAFRADLQVTRALARSRFGADVRSLVFPRNQYTPDHVRAAAELGITAYRGNPETWMYRPRSVEEESRVRRLARFADAFLPVSSDLSFLLRDAEPVNVPASRFLRPWGARERWAEPLRLARIQRELRAAAERGRAYHLWWHPHNFGARPDENLAALATVLDELARLRRSHGMRSVTMADAAVLAKAHAHV